MPTHNRRPFIARSIACFQRQTYPNRELVILDDGSDPIADLVPDDPVIRYIRAPKFASLGGKRNAACEAAAGDVLLHWDDDDWYAPHRVQAQVEALCASGADLCGIDRVWFLDPGAVAGWEYVYPAGGAPWVCGATLCFRREFWRAHPFALINVGEDTLFAAAADRARLHVLPDKGIFVGLIHNANTCPRPTHNALWRPAPVAEISAAMGADWGHYVADPQPVVASAKNASAENASAGNVSAGNASAGNVSVVIPHGGTQRLPHLAACLAQLAQARGIGEIVVVELGDVPVAQDIAARWRASHVFARDEGAFSRARALNIGAALACCDHVLWLDNDLLVPTDFAVAAVSELQRRNLDFLIPYSVVHYMSERDSDMVTTGTMDRESCRPVLSMASGRMVSGGAGLVRRDFVRRHGGIPEGFRGWGGEDNAWVHKASLLGRSDVSGDPAQKLWHIYHPTSGAHDAQVHHKNPHYRENLRLLESIGAVCDPQAFRERFPPPPPSCPWPREQVIVFIADAAARSAADRAAQGMKQMLDLDIGVRPAGADLAGCSPDAIVLFGTETQHDAPTLAIAAADLALDTLPLAATIAQSLSHLLNATGVRPVSTATDDLAVWTYWEGPCPDWIVACRATIAAHAPRHRPLDRQAFEALRRHDRDIDIDRLEIAHRADFIRAYLLAHHGGLWIDCDCIAMTSLAPLLDHLRSDDFLAHRDRQNFFPNGFIGARRGSAIGMEFYQRICAILRSGATLGWISLGGEPLTRLLNSTPTPFRQIPCNWIQPVCWSEPERFFVHADAVTHRRAIDADARCYMLSNTEIRKYQATHPDHDLVVRRGFFRFLIDLSAQNAVQESDDPVLETGVPVTAPVTRDIFERLYHSNAAGGGESASGPGSSLGQTAVLRRSLPLLLQNLGVRTLIDAPCGDFNWLRHVELGVDTYLGVDIVAAVVERNQAAFANPRRQFQHADIARQVLPRADLILCRDCLVHLSFADMRQALRNFVRSGSTYLLTTNFAPHRTNADISTGDWRPLNFLAEPFNFPAPLHRLIEGCTEMNAIYTDKSLSLWRLEDIPQ